MAKTDTQRINDTLNFLQNTNIVTNAERTPAYQLALAFVNARFPVANAGTPAYHQFSQSMSLGYHALSDPNQRRRMARALFLLWKAIEDHDPQFPMPHANAAQINQATAERQLRNYIRKARCVYETIHGGHAGANHVVTQVFLINPLQFLDENKVFIAGSGALDATQAPRNVQPSVFFYAPGRDRYEFQVNGFGGNGIAPLNVESVTAFHWTNPRYLPPPPLPPAVPPPPNIATANFSNMTGIELSGANMMVTTQFTGCAFCMAEHNGSMYCAHVSPSVPGMAANITGDPLARRIIATNGAFANAGGTQVRVFGRNVGSAPNPQGYSIGNGGGNDTYMTIVGFLGGTSYEIYSQTTRANRIHATRKIYG